MLADNSSHSIRVDPGTGTGADNSLNIHVSISLTSCNAIDGVCSVDWLLKIDQIFSLQIHTTPMLNIICHRINGTRYSSQNGKSE